ncbi:MAG: alkaline shock response membrane anchor protein AmaP [bacterium]|nr:alkaline shock response membrane anchor protein AmaP [bacterium]
MRRKIDKYIKYYLTLTTKLLGFIFSGIGLTGLTIVLILFANTDLELSELSFEDEALQDGTAINYYLPYLIPGLVFSIFSLVGLLILLFYYRKKARIVNLLMRTNPIKATVVRNILNFHVKVNNVPRREVTFKTDDGSLYEYRFFGEQLAAVLSENSALEIVVDGKKAYPAISFFEHVTEPSNSSRQRRSTSTHSSQPPNESAFESFVESAENFEKMGDKESAISFYEGAISFKKDATVGRKLIVLYNLTDQNDKATKLEEEMKRW